MSTAIDTFATLIVEALDRLDTIALVLGPPDRPGSPPSILASSSALGRRVGERQMQGGFSNLLLPETNRASLDAITRASQDGTKLSGEILLAGEAAPFWLGFSLTTVSVPGVSAKCVVIGRDITDQIRRNGDDRATQRLLAAAFASVDAAVAVVTAAGRVVTASQGFATLCGRAKRELTGIALTNIFDADVRTRLQRALATNAPGCPATEFRGGGMRFDGTPFSASFSLSVIDGRAGERLAVVTIHRDAAAAAAKDEPEAGPEAVSKILLVGLAEVKATLGANWPRLADRAMTLAEAAIRRRLGERDIVSRTSTQEFVIWFQKGTAEENEVLAARIARDVRIVLLTEFADVLVSSVASATVALPRGVVPGHLPAGAHDELDRHPGLQPDPAMEAARAYLAWAEQELPVDLEQIFDRGGQPLATVSCSLPDTVAARVEQASATLGRETLGGSELDILRVRTAVAVAAKPAAGNVPRSCFVQVSCACLASSRSHGAIMEVMRGIDPAVGSRLTLMLRGPFTDFNPNRLRVLVTPLCRHVRMVGLAVDGIADLPMEALARPFLVVSFKPGELKGENAEVDLWKAIDVIHRTGAKVIARQASTPNEARKLLELGVDLVCGMAPASALA